MRSLAIFMTFGGSLDIWRRAGILERELALYANHAAEGVEIVLVSYGGLEELEIASDFPFVRVLCNRFRLHPRIYNEMLPWLHRKALEDVDLIKTNQLPGARQAIRAARLVNCPVVVRQGYGFVQHTLFEHAAVDITGTAYSGAAPLLLLAGDTDNDSDVDIHDVTWLMYQWNSGWFRSDQ